MRLSSFGLIDMVTIVSFFVILASNGMSILSAEYGYYALAAWFICALFGNNAAMLKVLRQSSFKYSILYCFLLILTSLIGSDLLWGIKVSLAFILMISPAIVVTYYLKVNKSTKRIGQIIIILICILSAYGSYFGYMDDDYGRQVTSGDYEGAQLAFTGVAMASGAAVLSVFIISQIVNKNIDWNIAVILVLLSLIALVITSGSTITTVCLLLFVLFTIVPYSHTKALLTIIAFVVFLLIIFHEQVGSIIIDFGNSLDNRTSSERFVSLGSAIAYGDRAADSAYFFDRIDRPLLSLTTFFNNPVFGVAYKYGNNWDLAYKAGVGCHGEWADALARFGLFAIVYFKIFSSLIKELKVLSGKAWTYIWLVLGFVNPVVSFYSSLILFFVIPSWSQNRK